MLSRKRKRIRLIGFGLVTLALSAFLVGYAFRDGIEFFRSPSEVVDNPPEFGERFRIGGLVVPNSVNVLFDGSTSFHVTDNISSWFINRFTNIMFTCYNRLEISII